MSSCFFFLKDFDQNIKMILFTLLNAPMATVNPRSVGPPKKRKGMKTRTEVARLSA